MLTSNGYQLDESPRRWGELSDAGAVLGDRDAAWERLRRDGHLLLRGFLDPGQVLHFRRHVFEKLAPSGLLEPGSDPVDGIAAAGAEVDQERLRAALFRDLVPGSEYRQLCRAPRIVDFFGWLLADEVHLHRRRILRHVRPGERGIGVATQAHYDLVYLREGTDRVLSMWIPLGDCPRERGGLVYLEGSHLWVLRDEAEGNLHPARAITADLPALAERHDSRWLGTDYATGDVVVHSAHIIHAATDNVDPSGAIRLSSDIRYQRRSEPIDWRWQQHWHDRDGL